MTELRERMMREMDLRNLSTNTQRSYLQAVAGLARYYMLSPDELTKEMIEDYLLYLKNEKGNALTTVGSAVTGLRFFYSHVLGDEQSSPSCSFAKRPSKLPTVLSKASRPKGPGFAFAPWKGAKMPCPPRRQGRVIPLG